MDDDTRPWPRMLPLAVAGLGLLWGTAKALGVGDGDASGIVEESLGGPATGLVLALFFIGAPALVVGLLDGLAVRIGPPARRLAVRVLLVGGFGFWAGLWIYGFADIDCDGTCTEPDRGLVWATFAAAVVFLAVEVGLAALVARRARRVRPGRS